MVSLSSLGWGAPHPLLNPGQEMDAGGMWEHFPGCYPTLRWDSSIKLKNRSTHRILIKDFSPAALLTLPLPHLITPISSSQGTPHSVAGYLGLEFCRLSILSRLKHRTSWRQTRPFQTPKHNRGRPAVGLPWNLGFQTRQDNQGPSKSKDGKNWGSQFHCSRGYEPHCFCSQSNHQTHICAQPLTECNTEYPLTWFQFKNFILF